MRAAKATIAISASTPAPSPTSGLGLGFSRICSPNGPFCPTGTLTMNDPRDSIRRLVGKPRGTRSDGATTCLPKHYDYKARLREIPPTPPVPCMFYFEGNIGRICGDHDTQWDVERETGLLCAQEEDGEMRTKEKARSGML